MAFDAYYNLTRVSQAGDVIAIRVNARFPAWTAFARDARLVVRIAVDSELIRLITGAPGHTNRYRGVDEGIQYIPPTPIADWKAVADRKARALRLYEESLGGMTPGQDNPATSIIARAVGNELRMDDKQDYGARGKPLKVLSLGMFTAVAYALRPLTQPPRRRRSSWHLVSLHPQGDHEQYSRSQRQEAM